MVLPNGYEMTTTFMQDFAIANMFGIDAVRDTYKRAFEEWKSNYVYLTELVIVLNLHLWGTYENGNIALAEVYDELWKKAVDYVYDNLKGDELLFYFEVTD